MSAATTTPETLTADIADRHRRWTGAAMLAIGIMYAAKAAETAHVAAENIAEPVQLVMAIFAVAVVLRIAYWKLVKLPVGERELYFNPDSFVMEALGRALTISWKATFLIVMFLEINAFESETTAALPPVFVLDLVLAIMLGIASVAFLILSRDDTPAGEAADV